MSLQTTTNSVHEEIGDTFELQNVIRPRASHSHNYHQYIIVYEKQQQNMSTEPPSAAVEGGQETGEFNSDLHVLALQRIHAAA